MRELEAGSLMIQELVESGRSDACPSCLMLLPPFPSIDHPLLLVSALNDHLIVHVYAGGGIALPSQARRICRMREAGELVCMMEGAS